jgi:hypothetical protein
MSAQTYEPLRVVPPTHDQQQKMGVLILARHHARRALDAALATPRAAARFMGRLFHSAGVSPILGRLRRFALRLSRPLLAAAQRLGPSGVVAGVTAVVTNPLCRQVLNRVGRGLARGFGWLARKAYSAVDRGLRLFGKAGNKTADLMFAGVVCLGGKIAGVAAPVVHRVARFSDPEAMHVRLLSGAARSYFLHRVVKAFFSHPLLRLLVEGVLLPTALDSRAAQWLRTQLRIVGQRAASLQEQAEAAPVTLRATGAAAAASPSRPSAGKPLVDVPLPAWEAADEEEEVPAPGNRAERRAQERLNRTRRTS